MPVPPSVADPAGAVSGRCPIGPRHPRQLSVLGPARSGKGSRPCHNRVDLAERASRGSEGSAGSEGFAGPRASRGQGLRGENMPIRKGDGVRQPHPARARDRTGVRGQQTDPRAVGLVVGFPRGRDHVDSPVHAPGDRSHAGRQHGPAATGLILVEPAAAEQGGSCPRSWLRS
jgi:hypothetical protein